MLYPRGCLTDDAKCNRLRLLAAFNTKMYLFDMNEINAPHLLTNQDASLSYSPG